MILLEVVLQDGDAAYILNYSCFRAIVNKARFRQKAHYASLDSKCVKSLNVCNEVCIRPREYKVGFK